MTLVTFSVVGLGHIGKRHCDVIANNPHAQLVSVADTNPEVFSNTKTNVPAFTNIEQMLAHTNAQVVNICTPNGTHLDLAQQALNANRHVVIEKPMGLNSQQAYQIGQIAQKLSLHVFCVMQNRYSPPSVWLKQVVDSGILGKIYFVQVNCFWNRDHRYYHPNTWHGSLLHDGGTLFTQFSHFIDLVYWLFGMPQVLSGHMYDFNHQHLTNFEDTGTLHLDLPNGGKANFNFSTSVAEQNLESSLTIIAENGTIKVGGQYMENVELCQIKGYTMPKLEATLPPNDYGLYKGSAANHHFVIENVVNTLNGKDLPHTPANEGADVVAIIEDMYRVGNRISK